MPTLKGRCYIAQSGLSLKAGTVGESVQRSLEQNALKLGDGLQGWATASGYLTAWLILPRRDNGANPSILPRARARPISLRKWD